MGKVKSQKTLDHIFETLYAGQDWSNQWELYMLVRDWERIVGAAIAKVTSPAFFRKNILCVYVKSSVWMQQVQFVQHELIAQVNGVLEKQQITRIQWLLQPQETLQKKSNQPETIVRFVSSEQCKSFKSTVSSIDNEECREALYELWHTFQVKHRY